GDRTIVVIAHRLETVADADTVVVLEDGAIVEHGRPADLLTRGGRFAAFWRSHQSAEIETHDGVLRGDEPR
ncbi:ABC transporter ATP-binding protein, partial [Nonomuraea sp. NPDC050733]